MGGGRDGRKEGRKGRGKGREGEGGTCFKVLGGIDAPGSNNRRTYKSRQMSRDTWHVASGSVRESVIEYVAILGELRTTDLTCIRLSYWKSTKFCGIATH